MASDIVDAMVSSDFATPRQVMAWASTRFQTTGIELAAGEARTLVAHLFGLSALDRLLDADEVARAGELMLRRLEGEPLGYLLGRWPVRSRMLLVDRRVLVPRPATETLVELVVAAVGERSAAVADVCTGSGAIALAVAVERPAVRVVATDLSADALAVARANLERLQAGGQARRVELREGDLLAPLAGERFDVIASNPPYIPTEDMLTLPPELLREPRGALESGADGLDAIRALVTGARANLVPGGLLAIEHGVGQHEAVAALLRAADYSEVGSTLDRGNVLRVTSGRA